MDYLIPILFYSLIAQVVFLLFPQLFDFTRKLIEFIVGFMILIIGSVIGTIILYYGLFIFLIRPEKSELLRERGITRALSRFKSGM